MRILCVKNPAVLGMFVISADFVLDLVQNGYGLGGAQSAVDKVLLHVYDYKVFHSI